MKQSSLLFSRNLLGLLLVLMTTSVHSFTPGKWSPLDSFLFQEGLVGPSSEIVKNAEGVVIATAEYSYNKAGKLVSESYKDSSGSLEGETKYFYEANRLAREERTSVSRETKELKVFSYDKEGKLTGVKVHGTGKDSQLNWRLHLSKTGIPLSGEARYIGEMKDQELFRTEKDQSGNLTQSILGEGNRTLGEIQFKLGQNGEVVQRNYLQGDLERMQMFLYNSQGLLESISFHVKQNGKWTLVKTHEWKYEKGKSMASKEEKL